MRTQGGKKTVVFSPGNSRMRLKPLFYIAAVMSLFVSCCRHLHKATAKLSSWLHRVCPHGATLLPPDGLAFEFIFAILLKFVDILYWRFRWWDFLLCPVKLRSYCEFRNF